MNGRPIRFSSAVSPSFSLCTSIRRDVLIKEYSLSDRQAKALGYIVENGSLTIQDFEVICPEVNRRTLQRDLKAMLDKGILVSEGATYHQEYRLK